MLKVRRRCTSRCIGLSRQIRQADGFDLGGRLSVGRPLDGPEVREEIERRIAAGEIVSAVTGALLGEAGSGGMLNPSSLRNRSCTNNQPRIGSRSVGWASFQFPN
jgi:hypothetical protein